MRRRLERCCRVARQDVFDQIVRPASQYCAAADPGRNGKPNARQIRDSPDMLRARAWLKGLLQQVGQGHAGNGRSSIKSELANMTPTQLKLWLLKFDDRGTAAPAQYHNVPAGERGLTCSKRWPPINKRSRRMPASNQAETSRRAQNAQGQINEQRRGNASRRRRISSSNMSTPYDRTQRLPTAAMATERTRTVAGIHTTTIVSRSGINTDCIRGQARRPTVSAAHREIRRYAALAQHDF